MMRSVFVLTLVLAAKMVSAEGFALVTADCAVPITVAAGEPEFVRLAAEDLASDVQKITGKRPKLVTDGQMPAGVCVVIRTKAGGPWESYRVSTEDGRLVIEGGDARGTVFGVYAFIERYLKVDPLYYWSGREPEKRAELRWDSVALSSGAPSFKFRGWFINDEDFLTEWKESAGKRYIDYPFYSQVVNHDVIRAIIESLVRSGFNLIIPASFIDIMNPPESAIIQECVRRGVFVSQHHVEPLGVSAFSYFNYWKARGKDLKYSYFSHPAEVREVWRAYAQKWAAYPNVIWQLGLRGVADRPMWHADSNVPQSNEERGRIISEAMAEQVRILDEVCPNQPRLMSTTLWAEGAVLNQKGLLKIPEGTIIVFADNSPGWKWQRDFYETPRNPKNTYGVYYHHALIGGGPHLAQAVPPNKTFELLRAAQERGAGEYAIFNVSNIREFVLGIAATAEMTWRMEGYAPDAWLDGWVGERFSKRQAEIANAYRIYFNAYQIHDLQNVPFLLDGNMFLAGNKALLTMAEKIRGKRIGAGASTEKMLASGGGDDKKAEDDAFWDGLSDAIPKPLPRRESFKRIVAEKAGFELALLHARTAGSALPEGEAAFLYDNLIYPCGIMQQTCAWLERVFIAHEALDLGDLPTCVRLLKEADEAFSEIPHLAKGYCAGKWADWYRGCKKLNITATLKRTRDVAKLAERAAAQK